VVSVPGKITRRYSGKLEIRPDARELIVVVVMPMETAVASVVAAESPPHAPMEALKAQAVATRSFFVAGKGRHHNYDFCDTTHCQFLRAPPGPATAAFRAATATRGLVLAYKDEVFAAMYSASCGGRTHTLADLGIPVHGYPYFAVTCNYCRRHPEKWVTQLKTEDAAALAPTESARLNLARKLGWKSVPGNSYSSHMDNGSVVLEGVGVGHGIGLCQRGGADMARHGASFLEILQHYYPNAEVRQY
jgi:stage II sporulation protein D